MRCRGNQVYESIRDYGRNDEGSLVEDTYEGRGGRFGVWTKRD